MDLWLLVERLVDGAAEDRTLFIAGRTLHLIHFPNIATHPCPQYVCVSYIWGSERVPNSLTVGPQQLSSNTLPALQAALSSSDASAFWIDAFCIPTLQPARRRTLQSMGYIYSQAHEVQVVLSPASFAAVRKLQSGDRLDEKELSVLEQDRWISSVWTYQEVINSHRLSFVCLILPGISVDAENFLNRLGYTLELYKKSTGLDSVDVAEHFPHLDSMQDLIADWLVSEYTRSSALAIMSNMDRRVWTDDDSYFFAMIGAVSAAPFERSNRSTVHLSETFMNICDAKGDYSYIFSSAPRAEAPSPPWRPKPGLLPSALRWHCWGEAQRGHHDQQAFFWLDDVVPLSPAPLLPTSKEHGASWIMTKAMANEDENDLAAKVHATLVRMGFTGSRLHISLAEGFFFPQAAVPAEAEICVLVSTTIQWAFGAPALVRARFLGQCSYTSGVFSGCVDAARACSVRLEC